MTTIVGKNWAQKLGEDIKKARRKARLTQEQLRQKVGLSRNSIGHYERGQRTPDFDVLRRIAQAVSADHFEIDDDVHIVFTRGVSPPKLSIQPQQLSLNFDRDGGITVRIETHAAGLVIRTASA